ncbi:MAG: type II toxin-antitoxin system YafQ family toxin [Lachnospiraceae bacterium]|nr:type II toxin-antitoxin system YafQ family toxin [Lachnospiraceae bacterium]
MIDVRYSTKFKKDMKTCQKRGYDITLIKTAISTLRIPSPLPEKNRDHALTGNYAGFHECHLLPDWLLIYQYSEQELYLYRTGTHADLFGK